MRLAAIVLLSLGTIFLGCSDAETDGGSPDAGTDSGGLACDRDCTLTGHTCIPSTGQCECASGVECGDTEPKSCLRDALNDRNNCGGCGIQCEGSQICKLGVCGCSCRQDQICSPEGGYVCVCPNGQGDCTGVCRDLTTDTDCGACDVECTGGATCINGTCTAP